MPERDYSGRDVVDKLGVKPGQAVALVSRADPTAELLFLRVLARTGRPAANDDEPIDLALIVLFDPAGAAGVLKTWKKRLKPAGGIWLLSRKRGYPHYFDQRELDVAGREAGLVDNKVCSVSDDTSAIRFVIRRSERA